MFIEDRFIKIIRIDAILKFPFCLRTVTIELIQGVGNLSSCLTMTPCSSMRLLYGEVTITGEGLQNLGLCSALRAFEQGGIFIVPHVL
jgi:hypothetical protein